MTIYMAVDLTPGNGYFKVGVLLDDKFDAPVPFTDLNYSSTWAFDSTTIVYFCAFPNGAYGINCKIQNFKISTQIPDQDIAMPFSNQGNDLKVY